MAYESGIDLIAGLKPKNNGGFALVNAADVYVTDEMRLSDVLDSISKELEKLKESIAPAPVTGTFGTSMFGTALWGQEA